MAIDLYTNSKERKYLNPTERQTFKEACLKYSHREHRAFGLMLLHSRCRISEALNILKSDIDIDNQSVTIETLKRRKRGVIRSIPLPKDYIRSLDDIFNLRSPKDKNAPSWDFTRTTGWRIVDKIMKCANLEGAKACAKGVRHGFAITCVNQKIPLNMIAKWIGYVNMETTAIYANAVGEEEIKLIARLWN